MAVLHNRLRSVSYKCVKIDVTKENYDNFNEVVDDKHCNILRMPPLREICHGQCDPTRWEYTEWSEVSVYCPTLQNKSFCHFGLK